MGLKLQPVQAGNYAPMRVIMPLCLCFAQVTTARCMGYAPKGREGERPGTERGKKGKKGSRTARRLKRAKHPGICSICKTPQLHRKPLKSAKPPKTPRLPSTGDSPFLTPLGSVRAPGLVFDLADADDDKRGLPRAANGLNVRMETV